MNFSNLADSMEFFTTMDFDGEIEMETAADVVRFSFIVQDSLSYLDLEVCTNAMLSDFRPFCMCCRSRRPLRNFVNTEEKCRQFFAPRRRLLYTLHLDLPTERECRLKVQHSSIYDETSFWDCCNSPHVATIGFSDEFHKDILRTFIEEALSINIQKEKILKWTINFSEWPLLYSLKIRTVSKFLGVFYPEYADSVLLYGFIKQFDVVKWQTENEEPKILEYLLHHVRLCGNMSFDRSGVSELISDCIFNKHYQNVGPFLKYISNSKLSCIDYEEYLYRLSSQRSRLFKEVINEAQGRKTRNRLTRMMQIYYVYIDAQSSHRPHGFREAASEALGLIWSSVPDECVTFGELNDVFGAAFGEEEVTNVFDFYVEAVGEFHESIEPRPLKHLCRTVLRRAFRKNKLWIPDAIGRTGLPKSLKAFLNLE